MNTNDTNDVKIELRNVTMSYGSYLVLRGVNTKVRRGEVFVIMGVSGGGKTTLLKSMIGLKPPAEGEILFNGQSYWTANEAEQQKMLRKIGVLFQGGALWSSMTLGDNIALPLEEFTGLNAGEIQDIVRLKLALVGLAGFEGFYPSELSGGMRQRAGLARAMALDPEILFFDEPSTSLDPVSSRRLDDLILELRDSLGATIVVVTHELPSILAIGDHAIFVDSNTRSVRAEGNPRDLLQRSDDPYLREFLTRGGTFHGSEFKTSPLTAAERSA
jgi:phospholipid/cholesterol/gamma-HCH transport system ATP-binding protein